MNTKARFLWCTLIKSPIENKSEKRGERRRTSGTGTNLLYLANENVQAIIQTSKIVSQHVVVVLRTQSVLLLTKKGGEFSFATPGVSVGAVWSNTIRRRKEEATHKSDIQSTHNKATYTHIHTHTHTYTY